MRKLLPVVAALAATALAAGSIEHWITPVDNAMAPGSDGVEPTFNDGTYHTFDLGVTVSGEDDWAWTDAAATLPDLGDAFFQHILGNKFPTPQNFGMFPALEFDCYWTRPGLFPNAADGQGVPGFAGFTEQPQYVQAVWFDAPNSGDGDFVIARYTVRHLSEEVTYLDIDGASKVSSTGDELHSFTFHVAVPEPTSLALLGLGLVLALIRRF
jgi:hypothetical protein